jgi:hypothetical protein
MHGEKRSHRKYQTEKLYTTNYLGDQSINYRIILKWILWIEDVD